MKVLTQDCEDEKPSHGCVKDYYYWVKNPDKWPACFDPYARFCGSQKSWLGVLSTPAKGDPYYLLAHQYIVTDLNEKSGAYMPDDIRAVKHDAWQWLSSKTPSNNPYSYGAPAKYKYLTDMMAKYNSGNYGVPKCPPSYPTYPSKRSYPPKPSKPSYPPKPSKRSYPPKPSYPWY